MSADLRGRTALVTGGGHGVGAVTALLLAAAGAHVIVNYFHSPEQAAATVEAIKRAGGSAVAVRASVADPGSVRGMFERIAAEYGGLDVLVNNAARGTLAPTEELSDGEWDKCLRVSLHGTRWMCRAAAPLMAHRTGAAIVNLSSIGATRVLASYTALGVSKAAVEALTRYLAVDYAPLGIRVNAASAGLLDNGVAKAFPDAEALAEQVRLSTPLGRLGSEEDLARLVLFLASDESAFFTGQTLMADGGLGLGHQALSPRSAHACGPPPAPGPVPVSAVEPAESAHRVPTEARPAVDESLVAVVGMGIVVPGADDTSGYWDVLTSAVPRFVEPGDRFDLAKFWDPDPLAEDRTYSRVAGYCRSASSAVTGQDGHWLRRAATEALGPLPRDGVSAWIGAWPGGSQDAAESAVARAVLDLTDASHREEVGRRLADLLPRADVDAGCRGPHARVVEALTPLGVRAEDVLVVDAACASSLNAVELGAAALVDGRCAVALCGGVEQLDPTASVMFAKLGGLSPTGRVGSLGEDADGTLFSDGAAVVALKLYGRARADGDRILAVLTGFGASADGRGKSIAAPNPEGQRLAVERARAARNTPADRIDWVVAHATGTRAGDAAELEALAGLAAPGRTTWCSSAKAQIGHMGWAAGTASLIQAVLGLQHELIPAQLLHGRARQVPPLVVPERHVPFPRLERRRTVAVSAFGFGGTNAHLLVSDPPTDADPVPGAASGPGGEIDVVAWSAVLPGRPGPDAVRAWLTGTGPAPEPAFPVPYPAPRPHDTLLAPRTASAIDPAQVLALETAAAFAREHGPIWTGLERSTGVVGVTTGMSTFLAATTLRCYRPVLSGLPSPARLTEALAAATQAVPPCTEDTQPGVMPNVTASRLARRFGLKGSALVVDSGRRGFAAGVDVAASALRRGTLDLALVLAWDGPERAARPGDGEGAVLVALARRGTAAERGWRTLGGLDELTRAAEEQHDHPERLVTGPALALVAAAEHAVRARNEATDPGRTGTVPRAVECGAVERRTVRHLGRLLPRPDTAGPDTAAPPPRSVVISDHPDPLSFLSPGNKPAGALVLTTADRPAPGVHRAGPLLERKGREALSALLADRPPHLRLVVTGSDDRGQHTMHDLLFVTARTLHRTAGRDPGSLGMLLGNAADRFGLRPGAALHSGFLLALARERPRLPVAAVACDGALDRSSWIRMERALAAKHTPLLLRLDGVDHQEVLYPVPLPPAGAGECLPPSTGSAVVAGGTGGIVGSMLRALAERSRPTLWVLGSSTPEELPNGWDALPTAEARRRLVRAAAAAGRPVREALAAADRLLAGARAQRALTSLRGEFGEGNVHYLVCDLTDPEQVAAAARAVYAVTPRIDLLVHGAGRSRPTLLERKRFADFSRIRDVKTLGLLNLAAAFDDPAPTRWLNIGSLSGVLGTAGDTDYTAANAFLRAHSSRLRDSGTLSFTLWQDAGLGSEPLVKDYLRDRSELTAIDEREGREQFLAELVHGTRAEPGGVYLGRAEHRAFDGHRALAAASPYLRQRVERHRDRARWECPFTLSADAIFQHHLVNGRPTIPGTFLLDAAAQAAHELLPGQFLAGFSAADFSRFAVPYTKHGTLTLDIAAELARDLDGTFAPGAVCVRVVLTSVPRPFRQNRVDGERVRHAEVLVHLLPEPRTPPSRCPPPGPVARRAVSDPYHRPESPVLLRGPFANTSGCGYAEQRATSVWRLPPDAEVRELGGLAVPALLLCATLRTAALRVGADGRQEVFVPRRLARVDVYAPGNDLDLAAAHPEGIHLVGDLREGRFEASAEGGVLLTAEGLEGVALGTIANVGGPEGTT
ncbi:SDR family oxidoreductase [Streptomyces argenteolus]|uniref:SDR family oxidoreductase n=1 Tax=Streptomyces argenteolus TaxID=67274 RepID=A0ABW6XEI2_9ACTN